MARSRKTDATKGTKSDTETGTAEVEDAEDDDDDDAASIGGGSGDGSESLSLLVDTDDDAAEAAAEEEEVSFIQYRGSSSLDEFRHCVVVVFVLFDLSLSCLFDIWYGTIADLLVKIVR